MIYSLYSTFGHVTQGLESENYPSHYNVTGQILGILIQKLFIYDPDSDYWVNIYLQPINTP